MVAGDAGGAEGGLKTLRISSPQYPPNDSEQSERDPDSDGDHREGQIAASGFRLRYPRLF